MPDITSSLEELLRGQLESIVEGSKEDVAEFGADILRQLNAAVLVDDEEVKASLLAQLKALKGREKIRASAAGWELASKLIDAAVLLLGKAA